MLTSTNLQEIEEFINEITSFAEAVPHIIFSETKINSSIEQHVPLLTE
ncbi:hypothetical protein [Domibacillus indicus]|nr:hypothetical protein [Domibacillus indicus]